MSVGRFAKRGRVFQGRWAMPRALANSGVSPAPAVTYETARHTLFGTSLERHTMTATTGARHTLNATTAERQTLSGATP